MLITLNRPMDMNIQLALNHAHFFFIILSVGRMNLALVLCVSLNKSFPVPISYLHKAPRSSSPSGAYKNCIKRRKGKSTCEISKNMHLLDPDYIQNALVN